MWECNRSTIRAIFSQAAVLTGAVLLSSCVSARMADHEADRLFRGGKYTETAEYLKAQMRPGGFGAPGSNDELLYLLDTGLALHQAGLWEDSNAYFALAEKHLGFNDYTSITEQAGTLLTSENSKAYRGEDFEKVLIHVYKALNYASLGGIEDALVEARLVNRRLEQLKREGEKPYKQNAFARYLSAILYEAEGEYNDAYVDYRKVQELDPEFVPVRRDLWRLARVLGMRDEADRWQKLFELGGEAVDSSSNRVLTPKSGKGELIIVFQNGVGPVKTPSYNEFSLPEFSKRHNPVTAARVEVNGVAQGTTVGLHDIEATAIENLREKLAGMAAKRFTGRVVKLIAAEQVRKQTGSDALGALTNLILVATDQADLRSWNLLPKDLQILRIPVDAGRVHVVLKPLLAKPSRVSHDAPEMGELPARDVEVRAGKKVFLSFRFMP